MITIKHFSAQLKALGLKKNDIVLLHSSLSSIGEMEKGADGVIDAFLDVIGKQGTLAVPVFGKLGVITERLKARPGAVVSSAPVGTLAAIGGKAKSLLAGHWEAETAHGKDTPFDHIAQAGGYICLLGVDQDRNTMLHSAEAMLELPYMGTATYTTTAPDGKKRTKSWKFYPGPHRNFIGLDRLLQETESMKIGRIGNAQIRLINAKQMMEVALFAGKDDPAFVLCENPACADCVRQRAALFRARMAQEAFQLSASGRLAGRYVPEMIENLHATGIDLVELDYLQGKACAFLPEDKLAAIVTEFQQENIAASALRSPIVPEDWEALLAKCKQTGIPRLIVPLSGSAPEAKLQKKYKVEILFANHAQTSSQIAALFSALSAPLKPGIAFNPAQSALAGEGPFGRTWRAAKLAGCIRQLDLVDALWDGTPTPLANGNAEIKELVSILRCRNFNGTLTLGGGTHLPGTLQKNATDFLTLLENM